MTYDVLYIDCPWQYANVRTGGSHTSGSAQKYPTLSLAQLMELPVPEIAATNAVCFLWGTTPIGTYPFDVLRAWDFTYKTKLYWRKRILVPGTDGRAATKLGRKGTGYWLAGEVEELLIGVRGKVPAWRSGIDNWLDAPLPILEQVPGEHSAKPEEVVRLIERLTPGARRVELFATEYSRDLAMKSPGWDCYGLDLGHDFLQPGFWQRVQEQEDEHVESLADA